MVFEQTHTIRDIHVDAFGRTTPATLLYFAQEAAGGHCQLLGLDWDTLAQKDLFWAVIRQRVQVTRLPMRGETIKVQTWPMPTTRTAYPRATVGYDADGKELFRVMGIWVLMNLKTRAMVLPGKSGVEVPGILRGNELPTPTSLGPALYENETIRKVLFSQLDRNGHMNNTHYLSWLSDLLPAAFHKEHPVKDFTVCYQSEALENQAISLRWELNNDGLLQVNALREKTDVPGGKDRVFSAQVQF
jgi:acyl-ACP thioesterase